MTAKEAAVAAVVVGAVAAAGIGGLIASRPTGIATAMAAGYGDVMLRKGGYVAFRNEADGGRSEVAVDHSPCAKTMKGDCRSTFKGIPTVLGNVMQAGTWAGADCIEAPCLVSAGEPPP